MMITIDKDFEIRHAYIIHSIKIDILTYSIYTPYTPYIHKRI